MSIWTRSKALEVQLFIDGNGNLYYFSTNGFYNDMNDQEENSMIVTNHAVKCEA